jgi:hypothetical protein
MSNLLLADIIAIIHLGYYVILGFILIVVGIILRWKWIRSLPFRITHLLAIVGVACEALLGVNCPLTVLEFKLRYASCLSGKKVSFIGNIIDSILFYNAPVYNNLYRLCHNSNNNIYYSATQKKRSFRLGRRFSQINADIFLYYKS